MSSEPIKPIILKTTQTEVAVHLLARAFHNDPLMIYCVPNKQRRERLLPVLCRVVVNYCLRYGTIYTTPDLDGLVCCLPPGQTKTTGRLARASLSSVPVQLGLTGLQRFLHVSKYIDQAQKQAVSGVYWYIWMLGVDPEHQGQGLGSQLLQTVLEQARAQRLPCYLDTQNPHNIPFYQRHGFHQVSSAMIAGSDIHVYAMLWEPDKASPLTLP